MTILYPNDLISRVNDFERVHPNYLGGELANAISFTNYGDRPAFVDVFIYRPEKDILRYVEDAGLIYPKQRFEASDPRFVPNLFDNPEIFWSRVIFTKGIYHAQEKLDNKTYLDSIIIPLLQIMGISVRKMMNELNYNFMRPYLGTLGGDVLQDTFFPFESTWDYRGDILGLETLANSKDDLRLSEFLKNAAEKSYLVENDSYLYHPLFLSSKKYACPKFVSILRKLRVFELGYDLLVNGVRFKRSTRDFR